MSQPNPHRRVPRRAFEGPVGVLAGGEYVIERAVEVGEGGMMMSTARAFGIGDRLVTSFILPNGAVVLVRAVVRNVRARNKMTNEPARIGVEFVNLEFHHKREIRNYVASAT